MASISSISSSSSSSSSSSLSPLRPPLPPPQSSCPFLSTPIPSLRNPHPSPRSPLPLSHHNKHHHYHHHHPRSHYNQEESSGNRTLFVVKCAAPQDETYNTYYCMTVLVLNVKGQVCARPAHQAIQFSSITTVGNRVDGELIIGYRQTGNHSLALIRKMIVTAILLS